MKVYDKAKWHFGGDYPAELPIQQAYVHTGLIFGWLIDNDFLSDDAISMFPDEIEKFKKRELTGPKLFEIVDGVLDEDMLTDAGNQFMQHYYEPRNAQFYLDYDEVLASQLPSLYHVEDTWDKYNLFKTRIDKRFVEWKAKT